MFHFLWKQKTQHMMMIPEKNDYLTIFFFCLVKKKIIQINNFQTKLNFFFCLVKQILNTPILIKIIYSIKFCLMRIESVQQKKTQNVEHQFLSKFVHLHKYKKDEN